jgi:hypothetical protein
MEAVEALTLEKSLSMHDACIARASEFALEKFANRMAHYFDMPDPIVAPDKHVI